MGRSPKQGAAGETSQSELVRQALGEMIMTGRLKPGDFLSESRLAEEFGVSRTPVREAIRILAGDGLVTLRTGQRAVVRGLTVTEIFDQFEAMAELEAACARLAARRHTAEDIAKMDRAQARCYAFAETSDTAAYYEANVALHEAIYAAAGNAYLEAETLRLRDRLRFLRISQARAPGRLSHSAAEHEDVLAAIRARDEAAAADAMRAHLIVQGEMLRSMFRHTDHAGIVHLAELSAPDTPDEDLTREEHGEF